MRPTAFLGPRIDPFCGGLGDRGERGILRNRIPSPVKSIHQRRARRTGIVPVGAEHPGVEEQRILVAKQLRKSHRLANFPIIGPLEDVVLLELPAERQLAAFFRYGFDLADELLLVLKQSIASSAILSAFVWVTGFTH